MQVLLVSTLGSQTSSPWAHKFPILSNTFQSHFAGKSILNCSGSGCSGLAVENNSDKNSRGSKCNFAIVINSGASSDPENAHGMAHFVEHLVHHGSEKYEKDDSLLNFLSVNDGKYNAFTDREITCYHTDFRYSAEALLLGLDMYADMLTHPKFDMDFIQKEVLSIENELHLRRCCNGFRIPQLIDKLLISGEHPLKKFLCGSIASLFPSSRKPEELRNDISNFHRTHYRPDKMSLVIQAPANLDELQDYVMQTFGSIPPASTNLCLEKDFEKLLNPYMRDFNKLITIRPGNMDLSYLEIIWAFPGPEAWQNYKEKPMHYIAELLTQGHPGGLRQFLLSKGWVLDFGAGINSSGSSCNKYTTLFMINIGLTQKGRDEISQVLEAVFTYIRFMQAVGIKKPTFQKFKSAADLMFRSFPLGHSPEESCDLARNLMLNYEAKHLITGNTLYFDYNPGTIKNYLDELKPENAFFVLVTADSGNFEYMTENWYGAKYIVQDLQPSMLRKLQASDKFLGEFREAPSNYSVNLNRLCEIEKTSSITTPHYIRTSNQVQIYYIPTCPIKTPQSLYGFSIISNLSPKLVRSKAPAFEVYALMLTLKAEKHSNYVEQLELGTSANVSFSPKGPSLDIQATGLNSIAKEVVKSLIDDFFDPNPKWDEQEAEQLFQISKQSLLHSYYAQVAQLDHYVFDLYKRIKDIDHLTIVEAYNDLEKMKLQDVKKLVQLYKSKLCIAGFAIGAATEAQVEEVCLHLEMKQFQRMSLLEMQRVKIASIPQMKVFQMGERCLRMKSILPHEKPFILFNYYQMDTPTEESKKITFIIASMIQDTVQYELRSKEQLGYMVFPKMFSDIKNGIGILVMANSDRHSLCHIDNRIENYIKTFVEEKLTREKLIPRLKAYNIKRDPAYVQQFAQAYLLNKGGLNSETGYRKVSVQVCHENLHMKCPGGNCCHQFKWLKPLFHIGKENAAVTLAGARKVTLRNSDVYFIESVEAFHRNQGK